MQPRADEVKGILEEGGVRFVDTGEDTHNLSAYCPFHKDGQEGTPSFYVYVGPTLPKKSFGVSFCHTCGQAWPLNALIKQLGINRHVVDTIIEMVEEERQAAGKYDEYASINLGNPRLPETILGAWDRAPKQLLDEGFDKSVLRYFDIGVDLKNKRITFPIRDHTGALVGVSGRTLAEENPRYKVYRSEFRGMISGYELNKSRVVWGLDKFYHTSFLRGLNSPVIICEGFKACMWVHQAGFTNTVALMGTFCSPEQRLLLTRTANEVILFLDNDKPGRKATPAAYKYLSAALDVSVARYPPGAGGRSPDDLDVHRIQTAIKEKLKISEWRKQWAT